MKTVVATQSNYIPWKGYFDQIRQADLQLILDCVQFTRRDWRNRNQIKTPHGLQWLSIPVKAKGRYFQAIDETEIVDGGWVDQHIRAIELNYRRAAAFDQEAPWLFERLRAAAALPKLSAVNRYLLTAVCERIGIGTPIEPCDEVIPRDQLVCMDPTERLLALCKACDATHYLSGPAARDYLDVGAFRAAGIEVVWMDYADYPAYPQPWGEFVHTVSIIDLLLNVGAREALHFLERDRSPRGPDARC